MKRQEMLLFFFNKAQDPASAGVLFTETPVTGVTAATGM